MSAEIFAAQAAVRRLLHDENVERIDDYYRVRRPGGGTFLVVEISENEWVVRHDHPVSPRPVGGIPGTHSSSPEYAIAWVLLDPWAETHRT